MIVVINPVSCYIILSDYFSVNSRIKAFKLFASFQNIALFADDSAPVGVFFLHAGICRYQIYPGHHRTSWGRSHPVLSPCWFEQANNMTAKFHNFLKTKYSWYEVNSIWGQKEKDFFFVCLFINFGLFLALTGSCFDHKNCYICVGFPRTGIYPDIDNFFENFGGLLWLNLIN